MGARVEGTAHTPVDEVNTLGKDVRVHLSQEWRSSLSNAKLDGLEAESTCEDGKKSNFTVIEQEPNNKHSSPFSLNIGVLQMKERSDKLHVFSWYYMDIDFKFPLWTFSNRCVIV